MLRKKTIVSALFIIAILINTRPLLCAKCVTCLLIPGDGWYCVPNTSGGLLCRAQENSCEVIGQCSDPIPPPKPPPKTTMVIGDEILMSMKENSADLWHDIVVQKYKPIPVRLFCD